MHYFENNKLYVQGKLIKSFISSIDKVLELITSDSLVVLLSTDSYTEKNDRNVICVDMQGNQKWEIISDPRGYPDGPSPVTNIWIENDELKVFRFIGVVETISMETGAILKSEFTK